MGEYKPNQHGILDVEVDANNPDFVKVYFTPPQHSLRMADGCDDGQPQKYRKCLLSLNGQEKSLTMSPIVTRAHNPDFLKPKLGQIERVTIEDDALFVDGIPSTPYGVMNILDKLPYGFVKNYANGLGFRAPTQIPRAAFKLSQTCSEVVVSKRRPTSLDSKKGRLYIAKEDCDLIMQFPKLKANYAYRILSSRLPDEDKLVEATSDIASLVDKLSKLNPRELVDEIFKNPTVRDNLVSEMTKKPGELANLIDEIAKKPGGLEKVVEARDHLAIAYLNGSIAEYEKMLADNNLQEKAWQDFFTKNPMILSMVFAYPSIIVQDNAYLGGTAVSREGADFADYLVKNKLTNNTAVVEIKKPTTQIFGNNPYRGSVYAPSKDLAGGISQVFDYKHSLQTNIANLTHDEENPEIRNIKSYAVHCYLVIGMTPTDANREKSLEFVRGNSRDVTIVTFDELLDKLKILRDALLLGGGKQ